MKDVNFVPLNHFKNKNKKIKIRPFQISFTLMFVISGVATDNRAVSFFQELRSSFIRPSSTPNSTQNHRVWVDRVYFMVGLRLIFLVQPINKSTFIAFLILCNLASSFHKQIRIPSSKFFRLLNSHL